MRRSVVQSRCALFGGVAAMAFAAALEPAFAQDTQTDVSQAEAPEAVDPDGTEVEQVVVTGSRLTVPGQLSPQPVQVVTSETLQLQGVTQIADVLDRIPALQTSTTTAQAEGDAATLNLRGLGEERTLVLVDGRRHVAGVPGSAAVDVSSIPSALIERVEVLTGGASAVYGSDAVTGVVNFILKKNFVGTDVALQYGLSGEKDGRELYGSVAHGREFGGGRGNVTVALQASEREAVFFGDRKFSRDNRRANDYANPALSFQVDDPLPPGRTFANTGQRSILLTSGAPRFPGTPQPLIDRARAATPRAFINDPRFSISSTGSLIGIDLDGDGFAEGAGAFSSSALNADCRLSRGGQAGFGCFTIDKTTGQFRPFRDGTFASFTNQSGGDGAAETFNEDSLTPDEEMVAANLLMNYELSPRFKPFLEFKAVRSKGTQYSPYGTFDDSLPISLDSPFIPAALRALINAEIAADPSVASTAKITIARDNLDVLDPTSETDRRTYRAVAGVGGQLIEGFSYELAVNYGRTEQISRGATRLEDRFFSAADAVRDPATGQPVCRSTLNPAAVPPISGLYAEFPGPIPNPGATFTPGAGSPCRPLNLFGERTISPEARAFISPLVEDEATIQQTVVSGVVIGDTKRWFSLPGGPVGIAVGAEYREEKSDFQPNEFDRLGQTFQYLATAPVSGSFDVSEAFAEVSFPIFTGARFADTLSLSAAARVGKYSTIDQVSSYKVDAIYAPVRDLRFRGGYATTVRAPNISELFSPLTAAVFRPVDPCDAEEVSGPGVSPNREINCRLDLKIPAAAPYEFFDPLTARFTGQSGGNPDLQEETSKSYTYGVVLRPRFVRGFTASVDYFNISIEEAIAAVSAQDIVNSCYDAPSLDNQYCALFTRNRTPSSPTFLGFNYLRQTQLNFSGLEASGVDFAANYRIELPETNRGPLGVVTLGVAGTYLEDRNDFPFVQEPDRPNPEKEELNFPEVALNTTVRWQIEDVTFSLFSNYQGRQALPGVEIETAQNFTPAFAESFWTHDASLRWEVRPEIDLTLGVNNLGDKEPFIGSQFTPVSGIGRFFFLRLNASL